MDSDWCEVHRLQLPPPEAPELHNGAPDTIAFDTDQELLWVGNECGRITSYYGAELAKYTSIRAHPAIEGPVLQFLFHEKGVISLSPNSVHLCSRRGLSQWHVSDITMMDLRCMCFLGKDPAVILVAGCQKVMYKIDVEKGQVIQQISTDYEYTMMKYCHYICAATIKGAVNFLNPETLSIEKSWQAHSSSINHMDARNNYLVTCGSSTRPYGPPMLDILAKVFDLRKLEQLAPIPFPGGAAFVQLHPKMSTTSVVASSSGQLQVVDLMNPNTSNIHQARLSSYMVNLVLAPSGAAWALADQENSIHLWGSHKKLQFTEFMNPIEFADEIVPLPAINMTADIPFSTIGMPHYREILLSAWPSDHIYEVGYLPAKIDPDILRRLAPAPVGYQAPNPRKGLRNEVDRTRFINSNGKTIAAPKFLSEKARDEMHENEEKRMINEVAEVYANLVLADITKAAVPVMYRNVEIKYSKFGVDDFDFQFYNKTRYSGLETHIANSYLNPLLQLLKFTPEIRNLALHHTASSCASETCMLCELGYLIDMLEKADGQSCQATNFLKTYSGEPEAGRLGTLDENSAQGSTLDVKIQAASRFLLEQIASDWGRVFPGDLRFEETLHADTQSSICCMSCWCESVRSARTYIHDLDYSYPVRSPNFSSILQLSLERSAQIRAWCDKCRRYRQLQTRTSVQSVPPVLVLNTALEKAPPEGKQLWSIPGWLPEEIGLLVEGGHVSCHQGEYIRLRNAQKSPFQRPLPIYELVGMVADINSGEHQKPHLVSLINVAISDRIPTQENRWHLFNDFLVRETSTAEALSFASSWKMPVTLIYQIKTSRHAIDDTWKDCLDTRCLYNDGTRNPGIFPLDPTAEAPTAGSPVAIDSEFVALRAEEIEISASGEREVIRPTRLGLARVSVLRGSGPNQSTPFINDHISIRDPIVDYLTKYSGLRPGDLDVNRSSHPLISLKLAYKKLWLLLNLGVVFVGHGLPKDFRTINIHIPKSQVLDTVDLFYIRSRGRKLSLRFLAWYLLHEDIQQETHDSIEDARTALRLWRKYEEFADAGVVEGMLEEIYRQGKKWGYKPPVPGDISTPFGRGGGKRSESAGGGSTPPRQIGRQAGPGTPVNH